MVGKAVRFMSIIAIACLFTPMAAADPGAPPVLVARPDGTGTLLEWAVPPGADPDAFTVAKRSGAAIVDSWTVDGSTRSLVDPDASGVFVYIVTYAEDGEESPPSNPVIGGGYPRCWVFADVYTDPPDYQINDYCLLPPPI